MEPSLPEGVSYRDSAAGIRLIDIDHPAFKACISKQGAQVLSFAPSGHGDLLWVSESEPYKKGSAIRGGIPVCWPWFGAYPGSGQLPAHGVVRTQDWDLISVSRKVEGITFVFQLPTAEAFSPYAELKAEGVELQLQVDLGARLKLRLTTVNNSAVPFVFSQALHTYFEVGDIATARVVGLTGVQFDDSLQPKADSPQKAVLDQLAIDREVDRIYYPRAPLTVESIQGRVHIATQGSGSAVVWNPWADKARGLSHFGPEDYLRMLCVETANCGRDSRTLAPGESHSLSVTYSVAPPVAVSGAGKS
ncbi:D-hexose-6-phosphate mutarotase [Simiduia sp. 21SJ11W-1]|uniref:D-hexose-6-phosphate mutarotase n=1 Tax=Simiduia sp. 21SJ11W-1 TaxID=2909669 RepID=UPI00209EAF02|nr:D-hexose-6-phosphate mutarotase [Simiduia sp. 21SJ11W-1]UTA46324.1 D-hexose-6-phosphate mutarotase [Simiduia sp. 21SJ11W-1]